jgi:tRNA(Ile)-lysidine synthase
VALTLIADAWASAHGRDLVVLTVDHGLRPESAAWTDTCARLAGRLGRPFEALAWAAEQKPATGLPAAARSARHRLLAEAARRAGARVLLLGHTADDVAEAAAMRAAGSTTPSPREWSPSPVWPEGRGLFVLRPLLEVSRADLRVWLTSRGETWIDDPANTDLRFARSRARAAGPLPVAATLDAPLELAALAAEAGGVITLPRRALASAPEPVARRFVALASVCAGRCPFPAARALRVEGPVVATLAGARIEADAQDVRIFRNVGEAARGGLAEAQRPGVWDGRFELGGAGPVRRLAGVARGLSGGDRAAVAELPAAARGGLPVAVDAAGRVTLLAAPDAGSLVGARLRAAAGLVQREPA